MSVDWDIVHDLFDYLSELLHGLNITVKSMKPLIIFSLQKTPHGFNHVER